jgi:hypothetical protein
MMTGASHALCCVEDLALKSFVVERCARWQMSMERNEPSRIASLERRVTQLEREKTALDTTLSTL